MPLYNTAVSYKHSKNRLKRSVKCTGTFIFMFEGLKIVEIGGYRYSLLQNHK